MQVTPDAARILETRYLRRRPDGVTESLDELVERVARAVARAELKFGDGDAVRTWHEAFHRVMCELRFLPNSPTLMNAGVAGGQVAACFVLPVPDSVEGIFDSLKLMARIQQTGGGTGFSFSRLRPRGDRVRTAGGVASGPVPFMRIFDAATESLRQGGRRRGANMGVLRVDHPDIDEFVVAKVDGRSLRSFNLSVAVTDAFMEAAAARETFALRQPGTGRIVSRLDAADLLHRIATAAWRSGEPGLIFLDAVNRANPTPGLGAIEATNPCGEVPLLPYEACVLGSINLAVMTRGEPRRRSIDWAAIAETTRVGVRFLDDTIEIGSWPSPEIACRVRGNRKIGLGVMGFAEFLIDLEVPYGSRRAVEIAEEVMAFIAERSREASAELAEQRGVFPNRERSRLDPHRVPLRNATLTAIAPTGSISLLAATSSGIEPLFGLACRRRVLDHETSSPICSRFLEHARRGGFDTPTLRRLVMERGTLQGVDGVPDDARALFRTALELPAETHLDVQAAFQKHVDNAVAKTINLPRDASVEDVLSIYVSAWRRGLKGVTVFRYGCRAGQPLALGVARQVRARSSAPGTSTVPRPR